MSNLMLENINGSTSVALPYDHGDWDKWIAMLNGSLLLVEYVADYVSSCPDSKIFILGYSLGADALMNSLCGTSSLFLPPAPILDVAYKSNSKPFLTFYQERCCSNCNYGWAFWKRQILFRSSFFLSLSQARLTFTASVILVVSFADETYVSGQPWNKGTCTSGAGVCLFYFLLFCAFGSQYAMLTSLVKRASHGSSQLVVMHGLAWYMSTVISVTSNAVDPMFGKVWSPVPIWSFNTPH